MRSPVTASSSLTVGCRVHAAERCPHPRRGPSGPSASRATTRSSTSSAERVPVRSSRCETCVHWSRCTCWSHSPGISQRPSASCSLARGGRGRFSPTSTTRPSMTSTSRGMPTGGSGSTVGVAGITGTSRVLRNRKLAAVTGRRCATEPSLVVLRCTQHSCTHPRGADQPARRERREARGLFPGSLRIASEAISWRGAWPTRESWWGHVDRGERSQGACIAARSRAWWASTSYVRVLATRCPRAAAARQPVTVITAYAEPRRLPPRTVCTANAE